MNNFKLEPFLWIHLAGLAVVPLTLEALWLSLAIGSPLGFWWLDFSSIAGLGIAPVFWLQYQRPFNIFSILIVGVYPHLLTPDQRKILTLIKQPQQRIIQGIIVIVYLIILWVLFNFAPLATLTSHNFVQNRLFAIILASLSLAISLFFAQVSFNVLKILLTSTTKFEQIEPYPLERIYVDFTNAPFFVKNLHQFLKLRD